MKGLAYLTWHCHSIWYNKGTKRKRERYNMNIPYIIIISVIILRVMVNLFGYYKGVVNKKNILIVIADSLLDIALITLAVMIGFN